MWKKPEWYNDEHDKGWDNVRTAFRRDWEQTKHDFGSDRARDLNQDAGDTVRQAAGKEDSFDTHENSFRFGYAAQRQYRTQHPTWNNDLETRLRQDYGNDFDRDRNYIRRAYEYRGTGGSSTPAGDESRDRI